MQTCAVGIDVGGTKLAAAIVDSGGEMGRRIEIPTQDDPADVRRDMIRAIHELEQTAPPLKQIIGVGIGVAGQVDSQRGIVCDAPNLKWHDVHLAGDLQAELKWPVAITNDVRAATWGEWLFGAARNCDEVVCVFVGTGIGAGIIGGGQMLFGVDSTAGEVGHMTVDFQGEECRCGNRGCWETVAGGYWLGERARRAVNADPVAGKTLRQLVGDQVEQLSGADVVAAAASGDPLSQRLIEQTYDGLAAGAVGVVNAFNPRRLIFGGGMIRGLTESIARIERTVRQRALRAATRHLEVLPAKLGNDAGIIGAAAFALRTLA